MAVNPIYNTLIAAWNGATQPPTGVTGTGIVGGDTTAQKLAKVNAWTIPASAEKAILKPSEIINAIVPADLAGLSAAAVAMLTLVLQGNEVDASVGTTVRAAVQNIFAGKATTLAQLGALVAPFDSPTQLWITTPVALGGAGMTSTISLPDCTAAGIS